MSEKVHELGMSEFLCAHCGEPITDGFADPRIVITPRVGRVLFYHKNREECLEASKSGMSPKQGSRILQSKRYSMSKSLWFGLALLLLHKTVLAIDLPTLVCHEQPARAIHLPDLSTEAVQSTDVYRFAATGLYLSSDDRAEYFYNKVVFIKGEVGGWRFASGYKTIFFDKEFVHASVIHSDISGVIISRLLCTKT